MKKNIVNKNISKNIQNKINYKFLKKKERNEYNDNIKWI